jgi:hypothetical protein
MPSHRGLGHAAIGCFAALFWLASCREAPITNIDPVTDIDATPARVGVAATGVLTTPAPLELVATVTNAAGQPLGDVAVQFRTWQHMQGPQPEQVTIYWDRYLPEVPPTAADGTARTTLLVPTAGLHRIVAVAGNLAAADTVAITVGHASSTDPDLAWSALPAMPYGRMWLTPVVHNDRIYLIGGYAASWSVGPLEQTPAMVFDPAIAEWTEIAQPPPYETMGWLGDFRRGVGASLERLHLLVAQQHYIYDVSAGAWTEGVPQPASASGAELVAAAGMLYLITPGGATYRYDPAAAEWTARAAMSGGPGVAAELDGRIYLLAGKGTLHRYDPASDRWQPLTSAPFPRGAAFAALDDRLCAFGGAQGVPRSMHAFLETYCYLPASDTWMIGPPLPYPGTQGGVDSAPRTAGIAAVGYNGSIYAFGGGAWGYANDYLTTAATTRLAKH